MEYCEEFIIIKSILEYCNDYIKPFNKLHFRSGNEPLINELIQRLRNYLKECNLFIVERKSLHELTNTTLSTLTKILMFLTLNTDMIYMYNLRDDSNLVHVLDICPKLPRFLLVILVRELHLDMFFYELLSYSPCWFSFQYFEPIIDSLKYIDNPYEVLEKVSHLLRTIFITITLCNRRHMRISDIKTISNKLCDCAMNLLRLFYTPDAEKFENLNQKQKHKYLGFALKHLLQLTLYTFDIFENVCDVNVSTLEQFEHRKIYNVCPDVNKIDYKLVDSNFLQLLRSHQLKIITSLLNALQNNVMMIKLDIFIDWVEINLNDKMNLQTFVGNMCYEVGQRIMRNENFYHNVSLQLNAIAIPPKTLMETVENAKLGDILNALDDVNLSDDKRKVWFDHLFQRTVVFGNDECLKTIRNNMNLINISHFRRILEFIKMDILLSHIENSDIQINNTDVENMIIEEQQYDNLIELLLITFDSNFDDFQMLSILEYQVELFGLNNAFFSRSQIKERTIEFFNKWNAENDFHQFLTLTFEYPQFVWDKLFSEACHDLMHVTRYCEIVKKTMPFSRNYYHTQIVLSFSNITYIQQRFFPYLLSELYFQLFYPDEKSEFLKNIIYENINLYLETQQFENLLQITKALNLIVRYEKGHIHRYLGFDELTAPVLLMVAEIMDKARWDLLTYTNVKDEILQECIQFIQQTSRRFLPHATEKDRRWISKVIRNSYKPLTQYYFQEYTLTRSALPSTFDSFLINYDISEKSEIENYLMMNYIRCTRKETEWLMCSERFLPHITDVMLKLSNVVNKTENSRAICNYQHCLINYANIVEKFLLPYMGEDNSEIEKLEYKMLKLIAALPKGIYEENFIYFVPLLLNVFQKHSRSNNTKFILSMYKLAEKTRDCKAKQLFISKLNIHEF